MVLYDPRKATIDQMVKALTRFRYVAYPLGENLKRIVLSVEAFKGFEQISVLENAIRKIPGVKGVKTDILKRKVTVTVLPGKTNRKILVAAIAKIGMKVTTR